MSSGRGPGAAAAGGGGSRGRGSFRRREPLRRGLDPRERLPHHREPRRVGGCLGDQGAPQPRRLGGVAVLLGGEPEIELSLEILGVERNGTIERGLSLLADDAVGGGGERFAEIDLADGRRSEQRNRPAPRLGRVFIAIELHVDRRHDLPAAPVVRIFFQMRFHAGDQLGIVLPSRLSPPPLVRAANGCPGRSGEPSTA